MTLARRHVPVWRRHSARARALLVLVDAIADEAALWPESTPTRRALERARRALDTARRCVDDA